MSEPDFIRGYWRSQVIRGVADALGHTFESLEPLVIAHRKTLGAAMFELLNELDSQEKTQGYRTMGMALGCERRCREIAKSFAELKQAA
jgi:hypothetical protein